MIDKWIKAKPITTISSKVAVKFIKEVIHWYGVMNTIITDNDTQFTRSVFVNFCDEQ
jgi:hypothetical protein